MIEEDKAAIMNENFEAAFEELKKDGEM